MTSVNSLGIRYVYAALRGRPSPSLSPSTDNQTLTIAFRPDPAGDLRLIGIHLQLPVYLVLRATTTAGLCTNRCPPD